MSTVRMVVVTIRFSFNLCARMGFPAFRMCLKLSPWARLMGVAAVATVPGAEPPDHRQCLQLRLQSRLHRTRSVSCEVW